MSWYVINVIDALYAIVALVFIHRLKKQTLKILILTAIAIFINIILINYSTFIYEISMKEFELE